MARKTNHVRVSTVVAFLAFVAFVAIVIGALTLSGCAAGRGPNGEVVIGLDVATLPETGNQLIGMGLQAATGIPGLGWIVSGALGTVGAGAAAVMKYRGDAVAERRAKQAEDRGWEERERAAAVQMPIPPVSYGLVPSVSPTAPEQVSGKLV